MTAPNATEAERIRYYAEVRELAGPDLAYEIVELIKDVEERWNQGSWRENGQPGERYEVWREDPLAPGCQTSFCAAGWVAAVDGVRWVGYPDPDVKGGYALSPDLVGDPEKCTCTTPVCTKSWHAISVSDYARQRLQLEERDSMVLFHGENTLDDLATLVSEMRSGNQKLRFVEHTLERNGENDAEPYIDVDDDDDDDDDDNDA